jgi:hypothetical protein
VYPTLQKATPSSTLPFWGGMGWGFSMGLPLPSSEGDYNRSDILEVPSSGEEGCP